MAPMKVTQCFDNNFFESLPLDLRCVDPLSFGVDNAETFHLPDPLAGLVLFEIEELINGLEGDGKLGAFFDKGLSQVRQITRMKKLQSSLQAWFVAFMRSGPGMEDHTAGEGAPSGFIADNEMVAAQSHDRLSERNLTVGRGFRFHLIVGFQQNDFCQPFSGSEMNANSLVVFDSFGGGGPYFEESVETV